MEMIDAKAHWLGFSSHFRNLYKNMQKNRFQMKSFLHISLQFTCLNICNVVTSSDHYFHVWVTGIFPKALDCEPWNLW